MAGPWEKYQKSAPTGPWSKYARPPEETPQGPGPLDFVSQGVSGLNEGIANTLGFPVEATTTALNLASAVINKLTGSQIPQIEKPAGGQQFFHDLLAPTMAPESDDPALQMTRRIGEEVGAVVVPGAGPVAKAAKPMQVVAKELAATLSSGTGAAIAEQVAPGNPIAEFAGQMVGSMTPGGVSRLARRSPKPPSVDDLRLEKNAAYKAADNLGVSYSPVEYDNMLASLAQEVTGKHISKTRHQRAYSLISDMIQRRGKPLTLTELDQLRQEVRRDLITPSYSNPEAEADAFFGNIVLDHIDEMIAANSGGSAAMLKARAANTRLRKSEIIEDAILKATRRAESTGSGGNINNAIRQNIRAILDNPKRVKAFTAEERKAMEELVKQGKVENMLRLIGKLSPSGNGLMAALGLGATAVNPLMAAAPAAGMAAKIMGDRATIDKAMRLQTQVARGKPVPKPAFLSPGSRNALMVGQGANQTRRNGPIEITVRGGR